MKLSFKLWNFRRILLIKLWMFRRFRMQTRNLQVTHRIKFFNFKFNFNPLKTQVVRLIQEQIWVFVQQAAYVPVVQNAQVQNAGKKLGIFLKHFFKMFFYTSCPSDSGSFGGFCSSSCSCLSPHECQNGKCGYRNLFVYDFHL